MEKESDFLEGRGARTLRAREGDCIINFLRNSHKFSSKWGCHFPSHWEHTRLQHTERLLFLGSKGRKPFWEFSTRKSSDDILRKESTTTRRETQTHIAIRRDWDQSGSHIGQKITQSAASWRRQPSRRHGSVVHTRIWGRRSSHLFSIDHQPAPPVRAG